MNMGMRATRMGMVSQVAMRVVCRNPVAAAAPDHPRFVGTLLIDGVTVAPSRIHAAMGHRDLAFGGRSADRTRTRQVAFVHCPPVREHAVSSTFICVKRHACLLWKGRGLSRRLPIPRVSARAPDRPLTSPLVSADPPRSDGCRTRTCRSGSPPRHKHWECPRHRRCGLPPEHIRE
jgi:hypothetical protein